MLEILPTRHRVLRAHAHLLAPALFAITVFSTGVCAQNLPVVVSEEARKNRVGSVHPLPLESPSGRQHLRDLHDRMLRRAGRVYRPATELTDPLAEFKRTGDPRTIPDPRSGGRGNNANDRLSNAVMAWMLYGDRMALDQAILVAEWLVEVPEQQDHGHVQRHPALALVALATPDRAVRDRFLDAFLESMARLQNSRFFQDGESWMVGMAGVRPFLRAVGASHRFATFFEALRSRGMVSQARVDSLGLPFATSTDWLDRVGDRFREFCSWRKTAGDSAARGWQTEPGEWRHGDPVTRWPYLDSRNPAGRDSTWFHYGQIFPYEMVSIRLFAPERFEPLFELRTAEVAEWALSIGTDLLDVGATGYNVVSRRNWFYPTNPRFQTPFRDWTREEREELGEQEYCLLPALHFVRGFPGARRRLERLHAETSHFVLFEGEVNCAALVTLWLEDLEQGRR